MLVDATDQIVGRLGAIVAKKALLGEKIDIVNAEKAVISGTRQGVLDKYKQKNARGIPAKGPHYKRNPDMLLKRLIRNMLPFKKPRGAEALKNIMCWEGVPAKFKDQKAVRFEAADASKLSVSYVTIKDISRFLGGNVD